MNKETAIKIFEQKKIRSHWDDEQEKWYFSVIDVIEVLTESPRSRKYWKALKQSRKQREMSCDKTWATENACLLMVKYD